MSVKDYIKHWPCPTFKIVCIYFFRRNVLASHDEGGEQRIVHSQAGLTPG